MLAKWIAHATVDLDLSCFMLVLQKDARRESNMCDPFCENPAFLARAILTLIEGILCREEDSDFHHENLVRIIKPRSVG